MRDLAGISYPDKKNCPDADFEKYKSLMFRVYENRIGIVYQLLRRNNFETILIKGWASAGSYPKPHLRQIGDIDLAVNPQNFSEARLFLKNEGNNDVDLHCGLRHLETVGWEDLFENSQLKNCGETVIRVLRPEDHLRVLCVHWLNDGGADRGKLRDIYYAVENRPADFDWDRCLNIVSEKRRRWIICAIGLAQKYLKLNLENTPFAGEIIEIPNWLTKAVEKEWQSGVRLIPLESCLNDRRRFWQQIKKRFPPNPVQATIEMEGDFDGKSRAGYQIGNIFKRLKPSVGRIAKHLFNRI